MKCLPSALVTTLVAVLGSSSVTAADALPFQHTVEVYRDTEQDVQVFTVRLEQPFLAGEFEQSSYLRLQAADSNAYLIYPKETVFKQKHAEFYGRLRGEQEATLTLTYQIVSENLDGTRRVQERQGDIRVPIPPIPEGATTVGPRSIFVSWAEQQNEHFAQLLAYYPHATFYQYCLLQSQARYGVKPPPLPARSDRTQLVETGLYRLMSGSMAIQESLQQRTLTAPQKPGDLNVHISTLRPPPVRSLPYERLLEEKKEEEQVAPQVHEMARLVPEDQYFLHFQTIQPLGELFDLWSAWGGSLTRLFTLRAQDAQLQDKLERHLCLRREPLFELADDGVIGEVGLSGHDPFIYEGTDVALILQVRNREVFLQAAESWLAEIREKHPDLVDREFNYRGHRVTVHYTKDRVVSSFVVEHDEYIIYSNSHRTIRRVIDVATGAAPGLHDALDYRYVTTILPPARNDHSGYLFISEATIKQQIGPAAKVSEKRRRQCFNNLVMLNNASLFYRLEYGRSPESLSELIEGRFVDPAKIVCPHGGAYAFDAEHDTCTCSLHNRLKYLTPNAELSVLKVSSQEKAEYDRYKTRYADFWQKAFGPIALRFGVEQRVKIETCVLPLANADYYQQMRAAVARNPRSIGTTQLAPSAVVSTVVVAGREHVAELLRAVPGVQDTLRADPTLTDMQWVGDQVGLHFCDGSTILQLDPTRLQTTQMPFLGNIGMEVQAAASALLLAVNLPVYVTVEVENLDAANRLLEQLSQQIFLKAGKFVGLESRLDAYRLPDYKDHAIYVFSGQTYALKVRLHVALVGNQLVAATNAETLRQVIDAQQAAPAETPREAHALARLNFRALDRLRDDLRLFWAEKARTACHRNVISIYTLRKLYDIPVDEVPRLSDMKYGVRYFCPDDGRYVYDPERDRVVCSVHGNRQHSRQFPRPDAESSFTRFVDNLDEIVAWVRFRDDALIATLEIARKGE